MTRWFHLLLLFLLFVSCGARVWNLDSQTLQSLLANGDYSFLKDLDFKKSDPKEIQSLGSGSAWGMMKVLSLLGRLDDALLFSDLEISGGKEPWASEAAAWKTQYYMKKSDFANGEAAARQWLGLNPSDPVRQRAVFEALYWQKNDLPAQKLLMSWPSGSFSPDLERENRLYSVVLAMRLGQPIPAKDLQDFLFEQEASALHNRLYSFFEEDPKRYGQLTPWQTAVLKFKSNLGGSRLGPAQLEIQKYLSQRSLWDHRGLLIDLEILNRGPLQALSGIKTYTSIESVISNKNRFTYWFRLGRLQKQASQWASAAASFRKALALADNTEDTQRVQWNLISCDFEYDLGALEKDLKAMSPWIDPYYFSDIIDDQFSSLMEGKKWETLGRWVQILGDRPAAEDRAMIFNSLARVISLNSGLKIPGLTKKPAELWKSAKELAPWEYEGLMARFFLKEGLSLTNSGDKSTSNSENKPLDPYLENLIRFGFWDDIGVKVLADFDTIELDQVRRVVGILQNHQAYLPSLKIMYKVFRRKDFVPTLEDWHFLYPKAYENLVKKVSSDENLDPWIFFGLVREESHFDAKIKSWVGAVGLSQLMPATAAEVAARMKIKDPDLSDPLTNLALGARYFSNRINALGNISHAMMAYNAGVGRVKSWTNSMKGYTDDLFVEAIPFDETKNYVKKILRSSLFYSLLYSGRSLADSIVMVYPGLKP